MDTDKIFEMITMHIREVLPNLESHQFLLTDSLKDLGANSIDRSDILIMTLESLSLKMPLIEMSKANNIGELIGIIYDKL